MADRILAARRADQRVRVAAIAMSVLALALAARVTQTSLEWVGKPFPGFVAIRNCVVAAIGLPDWSSAATPAVLGTELEAVDGKPLGSLDELLRLVRQLPPGTEVSYRVRRHADVREISLPTQVFTLRDWTMLFGAYLLNGTVFFAAGLLTWMVRPGSRMARAFLAFGASAALFLFTAMDLYGPSDFFDLHLAAETLVPAALLQLLLVFPEEHRFARWRLIGYPMAALLLLAFEWTRNEPQAFLDVFDVCTIWLAGTGLLLGARLVHAFFRARTRLARQRLRVVAVGTLVGIALPAAILLASRGALGGLGMNAVVFTFFTFPIVLGYAVVAHDLFEIDAMVKRGAYYLFFTGIVGSVYAAAVFVLNATLAGADLASSPVFPLLFTVGVLLIFDPLRTRLQAVVDRVFFRTGYDGAQLLAESGSRLAASLRLDAIATLVGETIGRAFANAGVRFFFESAAGEPLREIGGTEEVPVALRAALERDRILTGDDPVEAYGDPAEHREVLADLASLGAMLAVPVRLRGRSVGLLTVGAKLSGLFFTSGDAEFLQALAHQAAIAIENARSYQALVELNADLENRVETRTAELANSNAALGKAYQELKLAEVQLVQSAKMASLGRLAAGVAHEINNPLSFIASNVDPLLARLDRLVSAPPEQQEKLLGKVRDLVGLMAKGAKRTVAVVNDLRSFSRINEAVRKPVDLREGLEVTIRLLEMRWRERIEIHREYGEIPPVECDASQINQVFMNLLANACDAIEAKGDIWVRTESEADRVHVEIRDSGCGISEDVRQRIFDPFFTTKDIGQGTGLGLAIAHGIVTAHGGTITVESEAGKGTTFLVSLPAIAVSRSLQGIPTGSA